MAQKKTKTSHVDLLVVGAGLSGMAAALFATDQGLSVAQISHSPTLIYHSGLIDVLSTVPGEKPEVFDDPATGMEQLLKQFPDHFYSKIRRAELEQSLDRICEFLKQQGLSYTGNLNKNRKVLTSVGTIKRSCFLPSSMVNGPDAIEENKPGLIVGFSGLKGFCSRQITEMVKPVWPDLRFAEIQMPGSIEGKEMIPEHVARALDNVETVVPLIDRLQPLVKNIEVLGLPPVLGISKSEEILQIMQDELGVSVFEIPMMPPSIPGMRLMEAFESGLSDHGSKQLKNYRLSTLQRGEDATFSARIETPQGNEIIEARGLVLATGRFLGRGLFLSENGIEEPLLKLPVTQPKIKEDFYHNNFFNPAGHELNRAGISTDRFCRPLKLDSQPLAENLFAIGGIQAGQDWTREKSGSAIAITSAFKAINTFSDYLLKNGLGTTKKQMTKFG